MRNPSLLVVLLVTIAILPSAKAADSDIRSALASCRSMSDDAKRLACYDAVERSLASQAANANSAALDNLGAEQLPRSKEQIDQENPPVSAHVTRCTRGADKKLFFYLENGQVWQQKSDRRLRFKECRFEVEISKDFFGYRMSRIGESQRFRVSRVR